MDGVPQADAITIDAVRTGTTESLGLVHVLPGLRGLGLRLTSRSGRAEELRSLASLPALLQRAQQQACALLQFEVPAPWCVGPEVLAAAQLARRNGFRAVLRAPAGWSEAAVDRISTAFDGLSLLTRWDSDASSACGPSPAGAHVERANLRRLRQLGVWVEVTGVLPAEITTLRLTESAASLAQLDPSMPWVVRVSEPVSDAARASLLARVHEVARRVGLRSVYTPGAIDGNGHAAACSECGALWIDRHRETTLRVALRGERCPGCGVRAPGLFLRLPATDGLAPDSPSATMPASER